MRFFLAAIRFIAFVAVTFGLYVVWLLLGFFIPDKLYWRRTVFSLWARTFVGISGMKIEVAGTPPRAPFFLVSNHLGYTDIALLRAVTQGIFVAKGEYQDSFLGNRLVGGMGNVFINRQNRRDIPRAGAEVLKKLNEGEGVIVFPEGTCTKGETIL
ncbi:MAG TPA: lysophospholipid acyltransferase family protein [Pyrinomonadaceae bacterium]|jgi:1-acyl-sn-glycerol-3-phosphate acyltransferase